MSEAATDETKSSGTSAVRRPGFTNQELGDAIGLTHSTASRMRDGLRLGSIDVLTRMVRLTGRDLGDIVVIRDKARAGDLEQWHALLHECVTAHRAREAGQVSDGDVAV